jgi:S-formylglutathione hydrolase
VVTKSFILKNESKSFDGFTRFYEHESKFTKTKMKFSTFEPQQKTKKALIWLSGLTCTHENFISKAGAQQYLSEAGLMVICPDTSPRGLDLPGEHEVFYFGSGASSYLNATTEGYKDHYQMYSYINEEIYEILKSEFGIEEISIFGHSMGGHGAITIALKNPDKYKSVSAFAPVVNPLKSDWGVYALPRYFKPGEEEIWRQYGSLQLIEDGFKYPKTILIDQGLADEFLGVHIHLDEFEEACNSKGQNLDLRYREGYDHGYFYISTFIKEHIEFHLNEMKT